ncbi:kinase-like domain-containing protein [Diaporthe sp. PMI_573]|nr:kinase-like domain-containing protein [Diaporthaceae sp. PMI_573]
MMATLETADTKHTSNSFDWTIGSKVRDGQYGPVFLGLRTDTGELISAEEFTPGEPGTASALESVVAALESRLASPSQPNVISLLGYELKEGKIFVLAEYLPGGTLRDLIQNYGAVPQSLARLILRQVVLGLEQLRERGIAPVMLDLEMAMLDNKGIVKLEAPLLDVNTSIKARGAPADALLAPPPELLLGQEEELSKADAWLVGVTAAQMLTGDCTLGKGKSTGSAAIRIKEFQGSSAMEIWIPEDAAGKLDGDASDLIRQCLSMDVSQRPGVSDLLEHPFLRGADWPRDNNV